MILGVVAGRAEVDEGISARTLPGFLAAFRAWRRLILIRILLACLILGHTGDDQAKTRCQQKNQSPHRSIVPPKSGPRAPDFRPRLELKFDVAAPRSEVRRPRSAQKKLLHGGRGAG